MSTTQSFRRTEALTFVVALSASIILGAGPFSAVGSSATAPRLTGVRVEGHQLVDPAGHPVMLRGVNRMGTEYACIQGWGIFSGPSDRPGNAATLKAMADWHINAVRIPLNEDCWLDRETNGLDRNNLGPQYQTAIRDWVSQITGAGMVAIVDLHLTGPKGVRALAQQPMADADNAPDFWRSAAAVFKDNPLVIFDVFNEPYLERDDPPPADPWVCWRDGCTVHVHEGDDQRQTDGLYQAAGMQQLVEAVRATGAANPIMLGGLSYADDLGGFTSHLPSDQRDQLIAAWHPYAGNPCGIEQPDCWNSKIASVMATRPVVAGEFGRNDCTAQGLDPFMDWMDQHGGSYLAWVWTVVSERKCPAQGGNGKYDLTVDYDPGTPTTPYGATVQSHYRRF